MFGNRLVVGQLVLVQRTRVRILLPDPTKRFIMDNEEEDVCQRCGGESELPHPCPYNEGMGGDITYTCNCCADCEDTCAWEL